MIFENKMILVTGGTGSLGKVLVKRILSGELGTPKKVMVFSRDEGKQHHMRLDYMHKKVSTDEVIYSNFKQKLEFLIGDVRDYSSICSALKGADIVINAAALKQVPTCEYFPEQAVLTNCMGAMNIVRALREHDYNVDTVVGISTDKACKPVNVMGITKAVQERIFTSANVLNKDTRFICVRYGNVLASRGSVIPLFHEQIRIGGPVTLTVPHMTRFLLSLDQAVDTVFEALQHAKPGETFVPDAPAATVYNIAKALIEDRDIEIQEIGIRPGEKIHEIMVSEEECHHTVRRGNYYSILPMLVELIPEGNKEENALTGEFSSENSALDLEGTKELFRKHDLMVGSSSVNSREHEELLR
jgi:FlaA1/EpsC-like NDP-sugar epimerase